LAADLPFDRIELGDPAQDPGGNRRAGRLVELVKLASGVVWLVKTPYTAESLAKRSSAG
jgi:hypothetical protein